jgi:hypothetical protein
MLGFITEDGYAAVPFGKKLMIIYNGGQLEVITTVKKAETFIDNHRSSLKAVPPKTRSTKTKAKTKKVTKS